jgi:hypothetical protein
MGILFEPAEMIRGLQLPKHFTVCELGDQWVTHVTPHLLAREWYRALGCMRYESIDANGRGTIAWDLNEKWTGETRAFDLVTDFGTAEHIFNQAQVWRTVHLLAKVGGFIVFDKPTQGYAEHGFYNYHETLLRDLAHANKWGVVQMARGKTVRGELIRGVFVKTADIRFQIPQQGRYKKILRQGGVLEEAALR